MINFLNKPYRIAYIVGIILISFSTFVLLDTFVIPKSHEISYESHEDTRSDTEVSNNETSDNINDKTSDSDGKGVITENSYSDDNIQISIETERENDTTYYVADIIIKDSL